MIPEVAFNTIITVVIIIFPGLVVRRFYYSAYFTKQFIRGEWGERIITSIFWGIIAQLLSLLVFSYTPWAKENDVNNILDRYLSGEIPSTIINNRQSIIFMLAYILFSVGIAILIGFVSHKLVRVLKLDIYFKSLRYSNKWHYYFKGETLKKDGFQKFNDLKIIFPWVDLVIKNENDRGKNKMIKGILTQYSIDVRTGELEYLFLEETKRFSNTLNQFKPINGHIFVIPFANVVDMNIKYKFIKKKSTWKKLLSMIFMIVTLIICAIIPWYIAKPQISVFKILLSYLTIFAVFLFSILIFITMFDKKNKQSLKEKITLILIYLLITLTFFSLSATLLGHL